MNKKMVFYEVDPKFFKDTSGDGSGDLKGFSDKFGYFKYLGIDVINLPNLLSAYSNDANQGFKVVAKSYGSITDLQKIIFLSKKYGIELSVEINIATIKDTHKWFKNASSQEFTYKNIVDFKPNTNDELPKGEYKYNEKTKSYYIVHEGTQEVILNWSSQETMNKFVDVIKFWRHIGIKTFVFTNFEQINYGLTNNGSMWEEALKQLRKFYEAIKKIDEEITVIGKSHKLNDAAAKNYTQGENRIFDLTQLTSISLLGTSKQFGNDKVGKFTQKSLVKKISKLILMKNNILSFGSAHTGRITSRWGNNNQYHTESAKSIALLLLTTPNSSSIYYGDELGVKNIGLSKLDEFQDRTIHERKRALANQKVSEKAFIKAQTLQNPINSRSLMPWNSDKNGGFSSSDNTVTPVSEYYRQINVENQFADKYSPLNFYKKIIGLSKDSKYQDIFKLGTYKISIQKMGMGVIKITRSYQTKIIRIFINFTNKEKSIKCPKIFGKIIFSTYDHKQYEELPKSLLPFEGIMISNEVEEEINFGDTNESNVNKNTYAEEL